MTFSEPCLKCGKENQSYRIKSKKNKPGFNREYTCVACERARIKKHQQSNREYWRELNRVAHLKRVGGILSRISPKENTPERIAQKARDKANLRCTRAKQARFSDELSLFVFKEAHDLRKRRNLTTGIEWHVDHIEPLKGQDVCGLHIWSNIQVIPKILNLIKGDRVCRT